MSRHVEMWVGRTDDSPVPPRVRLRVFERYSGICYLSDRKIQPGDKWELEHIVALCNGGSHSEDNMAPALVEAHKVKTAEDMAQKSKDYRVRAKHNGIKKPRTIRSWRKFDGTIVHAERER